MPVDIAGGLLDDHPGGQQDQRQEQQALPQPVGQRPLPQPAEPTPTPTPDTTTNVLGQDVGRTTLYIIAAALLVFFVFIGWWISRDARSTLL